MSPADDAIKLPDSILVIDDDSSILELLRMALEKMGIAKIISYSSTKDAWEHLQNEPFEAVMLDWKIDSTSGLALLNRLRQLKGYEYTPVIVVSGYLHARDFALMDEMPFTTLVEKPFNEFLLQRRMKELYREYLYFQSERERIHSTLESVSFANPQMRPAFDQLQTLIDQAPRPLALGIFAARDLESRQLYDEAEKILKRVLKVSPDSVSALTELGKVLLRKKQFPEAALLLRQAQKLSPENLDRLCMLGDVSLHTLDPEKAKTYFDQALAIDPEAPKAQDGKVLSDNLEHYLARSNVSSIPSSFAGLLNAVGISMVRTDQFDEGIKHYHTAMSYVGNDSSKAKLAFNLGLAHLRTKKSREEAAKWFENAVKFAKGDFPKAQTYVLKLTGAEVPRDPAWSSVNLEIEMDDGSHTSEGGKASDSPTLDILEDMQLFEPPKSQSESLNTELEADIPTSAKAESLNTDLPFDKFSEAELFQQLKFLFKGLSQTDEGLGQIAARPGMEQNYKVYRTKHAGYHMAVFVPVFITPKAISDVNGDYAKKLKVIVRCSPNGRTDWVDLWPRTASKAA